MSRLSGDIKPTVYKLKCKDTLAKKKCEQRQKWHVSRNGSATTVENIALEWTINNNSYVCSFFVFPLLKNFGNS